MVNKFGKGRVFVAGGRLYHLSISSLPNVSFKMQRMSTVPQEASVIRAGPDTKRITEINDEEGIFPQ